MPANSIHSLPVQAPWQLQSVTSLHTLLTSIPGRAFILFHFTSGYIPLPGTPSRYSPSSSAPALLQPFKLTPLKPTSHVPRRASRDGPHNAAPLQHPGLRSFPPPLLAEVLREGQAVGQLEKERVRDFLRFVLVVTLQVVVPFPITFPPQSVESQHGHTRVYSPACFSSCRAEYFYRLHSSCLDIPLLEMGACVHLYTYVKPRPCLP